MADAKEKKAKLTPEKLRRMKKKHPHFFRSNYGRGDRKRVKHNWRHPTGIDNKKREKKRYVGREVNIGHRNAREIRDLHPSALREFRVFNLQQLQAVPKNSAVRIAGAVGAKKRNDMVTKANQMGLVVLNK